MSSSLLLEDSSLSSELLEDAFTFGFHEVLAFSTDKGFSVFKGLDFCFDKHSEALLEGELISSESENVG